MLEADGLINVYAQRGIQIIEGDPKGNNDAYNYRLLLEQNALTLVALTASSEKILDIIKDVEDSLAALAKAPEDRKVRLVVFGLRLRVSQEADRFPGQ